MASDSSTLPILFNQPDSVRKAILIASVYPEGFIKLENIQKSTSNDFRNSISTYNRNKQKQLWEIVRHPELVELLLKNKDKSTEELENVLANYPEKLKNWGIYFVKKDFPLLEKLAEIKKEFDLKYLDVIKDYPSDVKNSFNMLLKNPELLTTLISDIKTTIIIGNLYKKKPEMVTRVTDSLHTTYHQQNKTEYEDWKDGIQKDSKVKNELKEIGSKYEKEDEYFQETDPNRQVNININPILPYPFWAGYPFWLSTPYWYPYPWWYNSGFYWYPDGSLFLYGMPSYNFGYWYYNHPHYRNRYPRATDYFQQHYEIHKDSRQGFNRSIREAETIKRRK
jgi:hypothetical protein